MAAALSFTPGRGALRSPVLAARGMSAARDARGALGGRGALATPGAFDAFLAGATGANGAANAATATRMAGAAGMAGATKGEAARAKARAAAEDFEAVYLNSMFSEMMTGIDGEGPFGGGAGTAVWRSFLTEEYAKSFARAGGIGLADDVYRSLLAQQEARLK